jgi:ubiquinone/menaquinone biosynthesis C-methylase UbiE
MQDWRSYDDVAETYERIHAPRLALVAKDLVAIADPPVGGRVLDVGTGTGVAAEVAATAIGEGGLAIGIDGSNGMLRVGLRERPKLHLAAAQAIDLPFPDGSFDTVIGNFVLAHFTKYQTALYDMIRVLRPGGRIALNAWADGKDVLTQTWLELVWSVVPRELVEPAVAEAAPWHERFRDREAFEETFMDAGLRHIRTEFRQYRFDYTLREYVDGLGTWALGRFVREMLGEPGWESFEEHAIATFAEAFADPMHDFRDVLFAVGVKTS